MARCSAIHGQHWDAWEQTQGFSTSITSCSRSFAAWNSQKGTPRVWDAFCHSRSIWFFQGPRRCYGGPVLVLLLYAGKGLWLLHPSVAATSKGETLESNSFLQPRRVAFQQSTSQRRLELSLTVGAADFVAPLDRCLANWPKEVLIRIQLWTLKLTVVELDRKWYLPVVTFKRWLLTWLSPAVIAQSKKITCSHYTMGTLKDAQLSTVPSFDALPGLEHSAAIWHSSKVRSSAAKKNARFKMKISELSNVRCLAKCEGSLSNLIACFSDFVAFHPDFICHMILVKFQWCYVSFLL